MMRYFMQAFDRLYLNVSPVKIRVHQKPDTYDFSMYTKKEYLENPELFYEKPERMPGISVTKVSGRNGIDFFDIQFPSPVKTRHRENNTAYGYYFKASDRKNPTSAIFLHGWGRKDLRAEKRYALKFVKNGINCLLLKLPFHFERTPEGTSNGEYTFTGDVIRSIEGVRQCITEIRVTSSWLREQGEKIVIGGISLGGMMSHLAMAVERFDAGITITAGGNNAGIIWDGIATKGVRDDLIGAGITREQADHVFRVVNPSVIAKHNKTENVFMINGLYDEIIPTRYSIELWEALGRPGIKWYPCAHVSIVFFMRSIFNDIIRFIPKIGN
ncbi:MAG: abhydrolase domain-containing 18 [wastewater metagenome]|nr:abhydrolase domain-containing 18 [Candidatus Loosdrechtia aerotolerans]